jgi:hypothetical protein
MNAIAYQIRRNMLPWYDKLMRVSEPVTLTLAYNVPKEPLLKGKAQYG